MCVTTPSKPKAPAAALSSCGSSIIWSLPLQSTYSMRRTKSDSVLCLIPAPWHIGALAPPIVICDLYKILQRRILDLTNLHHDNVSRERPSFPCHCPASEFFICNCSTDAAQSLLSRHCLFLQFDVLQFRNCLRVVLSWNKRHGIWQRCDGMKIDKGDQDLVVGREQG